MLYPEFNQYKSWTDPAFPLCNAYENELGDKFFIEPAFYQSLLGYLGKTDGVVPLILKEIDRLVKEKHKVIFTADYECPLIKKDDYIYQELVDITDMLRLTWVDDSRPSDYGD